MVGNTIYGNNSIDAQSDSTWSIIFSDAVPNYNQFLFATGNCQYWLVTDIEEATTTGCNPCTDRCILNSSDVSSYNNLPYEVTWYNRASEEEDPWISVQNHVASDNTGASEMVYGENGFTQSHLIPMINNNGGNVWIRNNNNESRYCGITHEPSPYPTNIPTINPTKEGMVI